MGIGRAKLLFFLSPLAVTTLALTSTVTRVDEASNNETKTNSSSLSVVNCTLPPPQQLDPQVTVQQIINPLDETIIVELIYQGEAWLGWGVPNPTSPSYSYMLGAQVVLGIPPSSSQAALSSSAQPQQQLSVAKWQIGQAQELSALSPLPSSQQTLQNTSLVQENGVTTLRFVRKLSEAGEYSISTSQPVTFLWAVGSSNTLGVHQNRGWYTLDSVPQCTGPGVAALDAAFSASIVSSSSSSSTSLWKAHGILMWLAFGVCIPLGIVASLLRTILFGRCDDTNNNGKLHYWLVFHRIANTMAAVFCLAAFGIAVYEVQVSHLGPHFGVEPHRAIGLTIVCAVIMQVVLAVFFRPPKHPNNAEALDSTNGRLGDDPEDEEEQGMASAAAPHQTEEESSTPPPPPPVCSLSLSTQRADVVSARQVWEFSHRFLGWGLLGLAWYNCSLGMQLFWERYTTYLLGPKEVVIFWCLAGGIIGIGVVGRLGLEVFRVTRHKAG